MKFNPKKCNILQVSRGDPASHFYELCGEVLQRVSEVKYLGILIASDLTWGKHINQVAKKANSTLGLLRRNLRYCPRAAKTTAYFSLVRSTTEYCAAVWDPHLQKDKDTLEKVNRRAARFVCNKTSRRDTTSVTHLLNAELKWPPLEQRRREQRLAMIYKITHNQVAVPPTQLTRPARATRAKHPYKYQTFRTHTDQYKFSFYPRTVPEWNELTPAAVAPPKAKPTQDIAVAPPP